MSKKEKAAIAAILATAKRPARSVELCLRGDLVADIEEATRDLALAQENKDAERVEFLGRKVASLKALMAESLLPVRLESMPRDKWLALLAEHPPVVGREPDESLGFNPETMYPHMIRESWAKPDLDSLAITTLLDGLNDGQFSELAEAAFAVNTRGAVVPFGWRGYRPATSSEPK